MFRRESSDSANVRRYVIIGMVTLFIVANALMLAAVSGRNDVGSSDGSVSCQTSWGVHTAEKRRCILRNVRWPDTSVEKHHVMEVSSVVSLPDHVFSINGLEAQLHHASRACKEIRKGNYVLLNRDNEKNLYHTIAFDIFPLFMTLRFFQLPPDDPDLHLVLMDDLPLGPLSSWYSLFQSKEEPMYLKDFPDGVCLEKVYVGAGKDAWIAPSWDWDMNVAPHPGWIEFGDFIAKKTQATSVSLTHDVIMIARDGTKRRGITNEDALVKAIQAAGMTINHVKLEDLTLQEQIQVIRSGSVLVGVHGAGLTNVVAARHHTTLIEVFPYSYYNPLFSNVAKLTGHSLVHWHNLDYDATEVLEQPSPTTYPVKNQNTRVEVSSFVATVKRALTLSHCRQSWQSIPWRVDYCNWRWGEWPDRGRKPTDETPVVRLPLNHPDLIRHE
jgi:hypothetical protein